MAVSIIPRIERGRLSFQIADALLPTFTAAFAAWLAVKARRLHIPETDPRPDRPRPRNARRDLPTRRCRMSTGETAASDAGTDQTKSLSERIHGVRTDITAVVDILGVQSAPTKTAA